MKKKFVVVGLSLFSLFYLSEDGIPVNASDNEESNLVIPSPESMVLPSLEPQVSDIGSDSTTVTNRLRSELRDLSFNINRNAYQNNKIKYEELLTDSQLNPHSLKDEPFAKVNNDMILKNGESLAAHSAYLSNDTGIDQTMGTASFTYTQADSVTTATTHSTGVSLTTSTEMKFPFVSGSMSMTTKYDFGTTNSVQSTTTKQWSVPSQTIKVPAGHKYNVTWLLNTGVATGTTDLTSSVGAHVPLKVKNDNIIVAYSIGGAIRTQDNMVAAMPSTQYKWGARNDWNRISDKNALRKWGTSKYTAQIGTELMMSITDVTNPKSSPVVVQQIPMNLTPTIVEQTEQ